AGRRASNPPLAGLPLSPHWDPRNRSHTGGFMNTDNLPARPRRSHYYPVALAVVFAACIALLLIGVSGGLLVYALLAVAAIALVGLLHYAVWGHNMPAAGTALRGAGTARPDAWQTERDREGRH